jgi:hypothetical protein
VSLVKPPRLTPEKIKANRRNALQSRGPKPEAKKLLEHEKPHVAPPAEPAAGTAAKLDPWAILRTRGAIVDDRVCPDYIRNTLMILQEDPLQFTQLHEELIREWQPSTPTLRKLVLRLAYLMWRQERAERAQDGVMVCRMEKEMTERQQRMLASAGAPAKHFVGQVPGEGGLRQEPLSVTKFEQLLDWLQFLMTLLEAGDFSSQWETVLQQIYASQPTRRASAILEWARQLGQYVARPTAENAPLPEPGKVGDLGVVGDPVEAKDSTTPSPVPAASEGEKSPKVRWEPPRQSIHTEAEKEAILRHLRRELAEEQRDVALEYKLYRKLNLDFPFYLRFSLCAPQDKYWGTAIYQEQSLGHEIDRTLRLIVALKSRYDVTVLPSQAPGQPRWGTNLGKGKESQRGSTERLAKGQKLTSRGQKADDEQKLVYPPPPSSGESPDLVDNKHQKEENELLSHDVSDNEQVRSKTVKPTPLFSAG